MGSSAHFPPSSSPRPSSSSLFSLHLSHQFAPGVVNSIRFVVVVVGLSLLSWLCGLPISSSFSTFSVSFTSSSSCRLSSACRFLLLRVLPPPFTSLHHHHVHLPMPSSLLLLLPLSLLLTSLMLLSSLLLRHFCCRCHLLCCFESLSPLSNQCAIIKPSSLCRNWSS